MNSSKHTEDVQSVSEVKELTLEEMETEDRIAFDDGTEPSGDYFAGPSILQRGGTPACLTQMGWPVIESYSLCS